MPRRRLALLCRQAQSRGADGRGQLGSPLPWQAVQAAGHGQPRAQPDQFVLLGRVRRSGHEPGRSLLGIMPLQARPLRGRAECFIYPYWQRDIHIDIKAQKKYHFAHEPIYVKAPSPVYSQQTLWRFDLYLLTRHQTKNYRPALHPRAGFVLGKAKLFLIQTPN